MAKLNIGEGIQLEAQLPEAKEDPQEVIQRTLELNAELKELGASLNIVEEKVDSNYEDILQVIDQINKIDMKTDSVKIIKQPEIKQVTFHRDHTKDFEDVYQKMFLDKKDLESKIKRRSEKEDFKKELKKQKIINLCLVAAILASTLLQLI